MRDEDGLSRVLSEFARTLGTDLPIQGILDHLVRRIVDILPIDAAGVALMTSTSDPQLIAGSDESATRYEHLQTELGEGPCISAFQTDASIVIPDLATDERFPTFVERALAEGLVAVFTFPLRSDGRTLGALDLYRRVAGGLDAHDMASAQTLADVAAAYLMSARSRQEKSEFVAAVSHELRTPMTSINGYVEILLDGSVGPLTPAQQDCIGRIQTNGVRLAALADDLLTIARLETAKSVHRHELLDFRAVVSAVEAALPPTITGGSVDITFHSPATPVLVYGNAQDLDSLVTNLLTNAVKFSHPGGLVECCLHAVGGRARLQVKDNGLGIPEGEQRDLFTRFFRSSTAHEHAIQGTGLGLTIVKSILEAHDGDISVESTHLVGTTVTVNLPLKATPDSKPSERPPLLSTTIG